MSRFAKLTSIDAVAKLATALRSFGEEASAALDNLELEARRAIEWIQHDRKDYWAGQVRRGWDQVAEARADLERCMTFHRVADHRPSCRDEKLALEKAKRRLRTAEEKVQAVRHWSHVLGHEVTEYRGSVNQLAGWLESDLPRALAALERMTTALESYVALESAADAATASGPVTSTPGQDEDALDEALPQHDEQAEKSPGEPAPDHGEEIAERTSDDGDL